MNFDNIKNSIRILPSKQLKEYLGRSDVLIFDLRDKDIRRILSRSYVTNEDREIFNKKGIRLIILYCDKGNQSIVATRDLVKLGYPVVSLNGGFEKYKEIYV